MKDKINKFLELWHDPKYKSLIKIGLYLLFILILILIVRVKKATYKPNRINNQQNTNINKTIVDKIDSMKNYEYEIVLNINNNTDTLKGIKYNDINEFENIKTSEKYEIKDNIIYKKGTNEKQDLFYINFNNLSLANIKTYLTDENKKSEISYNNNEIKKEYNIVDFNIINEKYANKFVKLNTYENENYIYKIELNIIDLMKEKDKNIINYNITINYNNINQIKNYNSN